MVLVYYNLKGTTEDQFQISKGGVTLHQGPSQPTGIDGDFWFDDAGELKVRVSGTWELVHFDNISFSGNTISSTNTDGDISVVPDGTGDVILGTASGGTSQIIGPDDTIVYIDGGSGTGDNDGGDLILRGGVLSGAGVDGDVVIGRGNLDLNSKNIIGGGTISSQNVVIYDFTVRTESFTAVEGNGYFVDTDTGVSALDVVVTLPVSPSAGDTVEIWHVGPGDIATPTTNEALTIGRNGSLIQGAASDLTMDVNQTSLKLIYLNGTYGWRTGVFTIY